jgi:hypothetical protein
MQAYEKQVSNHKDPGVHRCLLVGYIVQLCVLDAKTGLKRAMAFQNERSTRRDHLRE